MEKTDNELIAEFMGHPSFEKDGKRYWRIISDKWDHLATESRHLRYESQWNDLMPVVEKIASLKFDTQIHAFEKTSIVGIDNWKGETIVFKKDIPKLIDATYSAVVTFIKWYSQPPRE